MILSGKILVEFFDPDRPLDTVDAVCTVTGQSGSEIEYICFEQTMSGGSIQHIVPSPESGPFHEMFVVDLPAVPIEIAELRFWCRYYPDGDRRVVPWKITGPRYICSDQPPFSDSAELRLERRGRDWHLIEPVT